MSLPTHGPIPQHGTPDDPYVLVPRDALHDSRLSFMARGILIGLHDDPTLTIQSLADRSPAEGRTAVRTAVRQLQALGYWAALGIPRCAVCGGIQARKAIARQTYLVQRQRWVKIGASKAPTARVASLCKSKPDVIVPSGMDWSAPLAVLAVLPEDVEHALHEHYAGAHVAGEWFDAAAFPADPAALASDLRAAVTA